MVHWNKSTWEERREREREAHREEIGTERERVAKREGGEKAGRRRGRDERENRPRKNGGKREGTESAAGAIIDPQLYVSTEGG